MADERTRRWEKRNWGLGDEVKQHLRSVEQVEEELAGEQLGLLGLEGQVVVQMMGEREEKVGGERRRVDWRVSEGQEGWVVELLALELGFEGVAGQQELVEEECHRLTLHWLLLHLLRGAGHVHGHGRWHGHDENESEQAQELQDQELTLVGKPGHHS